MKQHLRLMRALPRVLRQAWTPDAARREIGRRLENRSARFLRQLDKLVYANRDSPYCKLLHWARCDYGDVEKIVVHSGVERALTVLRDSGVHLTLEEFKSIQPIHRPGLTIETRQGDFDNPFLMGDGIRPMTSGSRSNRVRVVVDWDLIREHAANELLLYEIHGVSRAPLILWLPTLPGIAGTQNLLMNVLMGRPPLNWFSQVGPQGAGASNRLATLYILGCCRVFGHGAPFPERVGFDDAEKVVATLADANRRSGPAVIRTYASSAVRVAQIARERGYDLRGTIAITGGEPLTPVRRAFIESAGMKVFGRYTGTDMGLVGASCDRSTSTDDMHVYTDRLAVIPAAGADSARDPGPTSLLYTSLSEHTSKVLLNADVGDCGRLEHRTCDCTFGRIGLNTRVSGVRSLQKFTAEGLSVLASDLDQVIGQLVVRAGGTPNDYEFWQSDERHPLVKLTIAVHPAVEALNEAEFVAGLYRGLRELRKSNGLASRLLPTADAIKVVRTEPRPNAAGKMREARKIPTPAR